MKYPLDADVEGSNTVFDYYFDLEKQELARWVTKVPEFVPPRALNDFKIMVSLMKALKSASLPCRFLCASEEHSAPFHLLPLSFLYEAPRFEKKFKSPSKSKSISVSRLSFKYR